MQKQAASSYRTNMEEEANAASVLLTLPQELLCNIFSFVCSGPPATNSDGSGALLRYLGAWSLTCTAFRDLCDAETKCRHLCLASRPVPFGLALSPLFAPPAHESFVSTGIPGGVAWWWQLRARLLVALPHRLTGRRERHPTVVGGPSRLLREAEDVHTVPADICMLTINRGDDRRLSTHPFVCTSRETLAEAFGAVARRQHAKQVTPEHLASMETEFLSTVLFRGVDYFEVTVVCNQPGSVSPYAVGVSQAFSSCSLFVALSSPSHPFFLHNKFPSTTFWSRNHREVTEGEVIGCGVDWDSDQVFFVRNPTRDEPHTTDVFLCECKLDRKDIYPAVGGGGGGCDVPTINFGESKPFLFDVKTFIEKKRAGLLATLPHLRGTGQWPSPSNTS